MVQVPATPTRRMDAVENKNILGEDVIITPALLRKEIPMTSIAADTVEYGMATISNILNGTDPRVLAIVGPCSIHNLDSAKEYAQRLLKLAEEVQDSVYIIMRVYFEKPRTTVGWKGLLNDPNLDGTYDIDKGLRMARQLLMDINGMGMPCAGEALDLITPQYLQELFVYTAIGARTTEAATHRNMASGLTSAVGFKNATSGDIDVAINAILAANSPHVFKSINLAGNVCIVKTAGNPLTNMVLRGGDNGPNFSAEHIAKYEAKLEKAKLPAKLVVDCSHGNSNKNHENQPGVLADLGEQIANGNKSIVGVMVESNLGAGRQNIPDDLSALKYGVSVTDACVDWATTETMFRDFAAKIKDSIQANRGVHVEATG